MTNDKLSLKLRSGTRLGIRLDSGARLSLSGGSGVSVIGVKMKTTSEWNAAIDFVPRKGEIIVYSDHGVLADPQSGTETPVPGIKIGDGNAYLVDLPFVDEDSLNNLTNYLLAHVNNGEIHVSQIEKAFWNNKLNCDENQVENEILVLNRN